MPRPQPSAPRTADRIREALETHESAPARQRMAAVRRLLHESVAGLTEEEAGQFIGHIERLFPDPAFEKTKRVEETGTRVQELEAEVAELRERVRSDEKRIQVFGRTLEPFLTEALTRLAHLGGDKPDEASIRSEVDALLARPERLGLFFRALGSLVGAILAIDSEIRSEESGVGTTLFPPSNEPLHRSVARLLEREPTESSLEALRETQRIWERLSSRWMRATLDSWRAGSEEILTRLHPRTCEQNVPGRVPGLRELAVLKEVQRRFDEFQNRPETEQVAAFARAFRKVIEAEE